jgi:hypothetical protein
MGVRCAASIDLAISIHAFTNRVQCAFTCQTNNPLVSVIDQMLRGSHRSLVVVGDDGSDRRIAYRAVNGNHRHSYPIEQVAQGMTLRVGRNNDQPINPVTNQHIQIVEFIARIVGCDRHDEQRVIGCAQRPVQLPRNLKRTDRQCLESPGRWSWCDGPLRCAPPDWACNPEFQSPGVHEPDVLGLTRSPPLITRETVVVPTPALRATWLRVA